MGEVEARKRLLDVWSQQSGPQTRSFEARGCAADRRGIELDRHAQSCTLGAGGYVRLRARRQRAGDRLAR